MIKEIACVFLCFIVLIRNENINCTVMEESNATAVEDVDGKMLLNLGRKLNKPMLTLLGIAIRNLEEDMHPCDEWTEWTNCRVRPGYISIRKRTRSCGDRHSIDRTNKRTETDINICEGFFCPRDYNLTANGFCVKIYTATKTFDEAEKQCQQDGGHVINIDSALKNTDAKNVLQGTGNFVYIDGRRKYSSSPWLAVDDSQKKYFNWASGEPDSGLCTIMHKSNSFWYDSTICTTGRPFMCEIVQ